MKKFLDELINTSWIRIKKITKYENNMIEYQLENTRKNKTIYIKWYYLLDKYFLENKNDLLEIKDLEIINHLNKLKEEKLDKIY